jgi:anti-anti-sigma regulatory factor
MLRITRLETPPQRHELRVEGRLAGEASLQILREELSRAEASRHPLVLELSGVSFVDQPALALLVDAARGGVKLVGGSPWLTSLLQGET